MKTRSVACLVVAALMLAYAGAAFAADKQVSDDQLYDQVKRRLANDPIVKGGALEVEVHQGVVTLRGSLESEKLRQKAEHLTKKIKGVTKVVNELQIARKQPR